MRYELHNPTKAVRILYDTERRQIRLDPGAVLRRVELDDLTAQRLRAAKIVVRGEGDAPIVVAPVPQRAPVVRSRRPQVVVTGIFGIGDNLHQRALVRELMREHEVFLETCHVAAYHDLVPLGLKLCFRPTQLRAQARTIERERGTYQWHKAPAGARRIRIGYRQPDIDKYGSIVETMLGSNGVKVERIDFSLPVPQSWRERALARVGDGDKPVMVLRQVVQRSEWDGSLRAPDPAAYAALYKSVRDKFHVVSVADLAPGKEWIVGEELDCDIKFHAGELCFEELAGLWAEADLVMSPAGFGPVLAQAVGTPTVAVYGGRESYRTTERAGAHLAPTLGIDPDKPCDCHLHNHVCRNQKHITLPPAIERLEKFVQEHAAVRRSPKRAVSVSVSTRKPRVLLFGTTYVDSPDRVNLTRLWLRTHDALNPDCDLMLVDSASPRLHEVEIPARCRVHQFGDNVGHLSRSSTTPGRDGWGRAFCRGLEIACEENYDYVVHVEGDSLLRLRVMPICEHMRREKAACFSTPVEGMRVPGSGVGWVETGLMFFSTKYLRESDFVREYDWERRKISPTPEVVVRQLLGKDLVMQPWRALRADKNQVTAENVLELDWVTHQHDSAQQRVYEVFAEEALRGAPGAASAPARVSLRKLNLGCGDNRLRGWQNHDADVDITKPLPWPDSSASHVVIEHCVEHVPYKSAIDFFREAHRVLAPGGTLRVTVPSLEQIARCDDRNYYKFTQKWQPLGATKRGAMHAIIYAHGHECAWNAQLMRDTLYFAGFDDVCQCEPGQSEDPALQGVEGHGKVIGDTFNRIESCTHEARKEGVLPQDTCLGEVALVVGGAECWQEDYDAARAMCEEAGVPFRVYAVNDHIEDLSGEIVACTLHTDQIGKWLSGRRRRGYPAPDQVWSFRWDAKTKLVTDRVDDLGGSSSLFAFQVARHRGHEQVVVCGVPMTPEGKHYVRHARWNTCSLFWEKWQKHHAIIAPYLRSMSGRTADVYGQPTVEWLKSL